MAYDGQARRAQKHHPDLPALTRPRAEPGRERLAVSPSELALKHRLRKLRRHRRRCLRRMAKAHRSARTDHIHRNAGLGPHRSVAMTFGISPALYSDRAASSLPYAPTPAYRGRKFTQAIPRIRGDTEENMAGHSQFKNIMHKKGKQDAIRSKLFSKLAREITVAAKLGLPDPAMNARLRAAVLEARAENMPKDNIDRAIKKASSADTENYDEVRYEGYAPGGVAVIVEALTDNRNRPAGEVRSYFAKAGGSLAETGAVSFMFDRVGLVVFGRKVADDEAMLEAAIEAGADDVVSGLEEHEVITSVEALRDAQKALEAKFGEPG